jgi:UDP-N-acetylmuramate-alanine ligase
MADFPGLSRRFETITKGLITDYAHTIPKIQGCLQMAGELSDNVVVVYEPLTNRRQHYIKNDYADLFDGIKHLYWVPSYLAREDPSEKVMTPSELIEYMNNSEIAEAAELNDDLKNKLHNHISQGDLVVCMSGGGGGSLDEWLRQNFAN